MKILIFYFSGTGNTWWVVRELAHLFKEYGHVVEFISIEKGMGAEYVKRVDDFDLVGFGYPVYGANLPPIFRRFGDDLIKLRKDRPLKNCFTVCTVGFVNAFGPLEAARYFKAARFKLIGSLNLKLSNNASTPHFKTKVRNGNELNPRKERAKQQLLKFAGRMGASKPMITGIGPYLLSGYLIRKISQREMSRCNDILRIDPQSCSGCRLCAWMCPTGSIRFHSGLAEFKNTCTACLRCYNNCPTHAIFHMGKYADPNVYIRYRGPEKEWYKEMMGNSETVEFAKDENP